MSYENNNSFNSSANQSQWSDTQWNGSTWSDDDMNDGYQSFSNDSFETIDTTSVSSTIKSITNVNFEENVLSQSFVFMAIALAITAFAALYTANSLPLLYFIFGNGGFTMLIIAELVVVIAANIVMTRNMIVPSAIAFTLYSVINGVTLSSIFLVYDLGSIVATFFITAGMFGGMAIYGLVTKKNLAKMGNIFMMALFGLILAGVVNIFMQNSALDFAISAIGVIIFVGLTAYDVQKIKTMMYATNNTNITCIALMGALELYLDFINLFLRLLRLFAKARD